MYNLELLFKVTEQIIEHLTEDKKVVANSKNYLKCKFEFSEEWQSVTKTAIFTAASGKAFEYILENDACVIPYEVINFPHFTVSVFGGDLITVNSVSVNVLKSGYKEGETPKPPTPDVYSQILEKVTNTEKIAENLVEGEELRVDAEAERVEAELKRSIAEEQRNDNENVRVESETLRTEAETTRQKNEESREQAEEERKTLKADLESLKENVEKTVEIAESVITHQPIIGENKNWFVWDIEKEEYVDTGVLAEVGVVQETGDSETVAMSQKATTEALLTLANKVAPSPASVTLYADRWEQDEEDIRYHQEVAVANATITPRSKVDLQLSAEQITIFYEKDLAFVAENDNGVVTVYCIGQVPENDYIIQATVSEVIVNG